MIMNNLKELRNKKKIELKYHIAVKNNNYFENK